MSRVKLLCLSSRHSPVFSSYSWYKTTLLRISMNHNLRGIARCLEWFRDAPLFEFRIRYLDFNICLYQSSSSWVSLAYFIAAVVSLTHKFTAFNSKQSIWTALAISALQTDVVEQILGQLLQVCEFIQSDFQSVQWETDSETMEFGSVHGLGHSV